MYLKKQSKIISYLIPLFIILISTFSFSIFSRTHNIVKRNSDLNILLITIDTIRSDRVGCYGYEKAETPNLDNLALHGVRFSNAYCQVPLTLPSHCSILTGTYPIYHQVHNNGLYYLGPDYLTLAEILKHEEFKTAAFVSSFSVDSRFGIDQGFDFYDDKFMEDEILKNFHSERKANKVYASFSHWLDENYKQKIFCWVHFFDPHLPYDPPSPFKEEFSGRPYDGEVAYADYYVGKTVEKLKEKNILDKTLIIIAGDHGEALGEKNEVDHGFFIYDCTLKVPLIFYSENHLPKGLVVKARVRLIDIMPTILDILKIQAIKKIQGLSLLSYITGRKRDDLPTYIETYFPKENYGWAKLVGFIDGEWKFIEAPKSELYNLNRDPQEEKNVILKEKKIASTMIKKLKATIKNFSSETKLERKKLTLKEQERLRSLGYLVGRISEDFQKKNLPDPKDKIGEYLLFFKGNIYETKGDYQKAAEYYKKMLLLNPDVPWNYVNLGFLYVKMKKINEAIRILEKGLDRISNSIIILSRLSSFYMRARRFKDALETSQIVLKLDPQYFDALFISGIIMGEMEKWPEALCYLEKAMEIEPENKSLQIRYASTLASLGRVENSLKIYMRLKKEYPEDYRIYQGLSRVYDSMGNLEIARKNIKRAVELNPSPETYFNYTLILEKIGDLKETIHYLKLYLKTTTEGETPRKKKAKKALAQWENRLKKR